MNRIPTEQIKAILFDSGHTLNYPRTGHWFIPPNFVTFFEQELGGMTSESMRTAFMHAYTYLEAHHCIETEEQEYEQFRTFYTMLLTEQGYPYITDALIADLAHDTVYNDEKFRFFDDVFDVIPALHQDFVLGVVSDTWPSLERVFLTHKLRQHFSTFIISSQLGVSKPHPRMFSTALDALQVAPDETLFVDDALRNAEGAFNLGIHAILIDRDTTTPVMTPFPTIHTLYDLMTMLGREERDS